MSKGAKDAAAIWREKLDFFLKEMAIAADPARRFELTKAIEEARARIEESVYEASLPESLAARLEAIRRDAGAIWENALKKTPQTSESRPPSSALFHSMLIST